MDRERNVEERESTLGRGQAGLEEGGLLGGIEGVAKGVLGMVTPRAGLPGRRGISDIFNEFVEFSPVGDIQDVGAAFDPNSGLDVLERIIAGSAIIGLGAAGVRTGYKRYQDRYQQGLSQQTARSMLPAPGQPYDFDALSWQDQGGLEASPEQQRAQIAKFEQVKLEADSPFSKATLRAENWEELAFAVAPDYAALKNNSAVQDSLRGIGAYVVATAPDVKLYGQDPDTQQFVAAKVAVAKWNRAMELGIIQSEIDSTKRTALDLVLEPLRYDNIRKIAQLEVATSGIVGPDLTLPAPGRLAQVTWDPVTSEPRVFYGIVDGLLPTERVFDWDTMYPYDKEAVRRRQQQIDYDAITGVGASNIARALQLAPEESIADPESWYRNFNRTARFLSELSGYSVDQTAGVIAAMSANTPWIPNNLVGAVHVILQTGTDLRPGTPEYVDAFKRATIGSGWAMDMFEDSSAAIQEQFQQMPGAPGGIPDFEGLMGHYADPANVTSESGQMTGAEDQTKRDKIDLILKGNVPPWLVLRGMKTNTFHRLGAEPSLVDLVVTDTWNDRVFWGSLFVDTPLAFDGYTAKTELDPDTIYFDPVTNRSADGRKVLESLNFLAREHGWTDEQVNRWKALLTSFPTKTAQARFLAQARAHLLVRDEFGMPSGHAVQAPTWVKSRLSWDGLTDQITSSMSRDELRKVAREGHLDPIMFSYLEGNPAMERTAAGMVWSVSPTLKGDAPTAAELKAAQSGAQREASGRVKTSIIPVGNADGTVTPYADVSTPGVRETLRHATPSGVKVGDYERFIANRPRQVVSVQDHVDRTITKYRREDGRLAAGTATVTFDPESAGHPGMLPGDRVVVVVPNDSAKRVEEVLASSWPFGFRSGITRTQRTGTSRNRLASSDLKPLTDEQLGHILQENDWVAITAFRSERSAGENWDAMRRLRLDIQRMGGEVVDANGRYPGAEGVVDEPSFFVTGITYDQAVKLGAKYDQEAVATRHGMLNMDGTYHPVQDKPTFGDSVDENSHTRLSTGQTFSFNYDWVTSLRWFEGAVDTLADQVPAGEPGRAFTIELGGQHGGANWYVTDSLLEQLEQVPGARIRLYTHSPNRIPDRYARAGQSVITDQMGITGSILMKTIDEYARHHADVHIPAWEMHTLSEDGFGGERVRRSALEARSVMEIDQEAGMVWFDEDLAIQVDPDANVTIGKVGTVFRSLRVNGKLVRELVVDTTGPQPILDIRAEGMIPSPGRTVVKLKRGFVTHMAPDLATDFADARDALAGAGLVVDDQIVTIEYPQEGPEGTFRETLKLSFGPHPVYGRTDVLFTNAPTVQEDIDLTAEVQQMIPEIPKVILGENAHPQLRRQLVRTLEGLHDGTLPGSHLVGSIPPIVWDGTFGINMATLIDEKYVDAVTGMAREFKGVVFNERVLVRRWNHGARPGGKHAYRPDSHSDFEAVFVHEVGHLVDQAYGEHIFSNAGVIGLVDIAKDAMGGSTGVRVHLSDYATSSHREFFAEGFAKVLLEGEKAHPALIEMVQTVLGRMRRELV